jgi:hypothetical protein
MCSLEETPLPFGLPFFHPQNSYRIHQLQQHAETLLGRTVFLMFL